MAPKTPIPQFSLTTQAKRGVLVVDLSRHEQYNKHAVQEPHRDDHFTLLVLRSGRIKLTVDFEQVTILRPAFFLLSPEQIHQLVQLENAQGWLINIDGGALTDDLRIQLSTDLHQPLLLDKDSATTTHLFSLLTVAAHLGAQASNAFVDKSIQTIIHSAAWLALSWAESNVIAIQKTGRGTALYRQFKALLEQHFKAWKQTSDYATEMAITASHLNDTVKAISGSAISVHIQERNVLEAKRLLYNTDLTASEIGYALGYEDPVYFGKLFKKHTALTPRGFRAKFRE
jgi:AraC-like DNA-binding protein